MAFLSTIHATRRACLWNPALLSRASKLQGPASSSSLSSSRTTTTFLSANSVFDAPNQHKFTTSRNALQGCQTTEKHSHAGIANNFLYRQQGHGLHTSQRCFQEDSKKEEDINLVMTQMSTRLLNENGFLSWCRNAYLSTVIGVAMFGQAASVTSSALAQGAGALSFVVGGMNLFWGTGCHISNLIVLRHATGMRKTTLFLNISGSALHCLLWLLVVICFIGFLDETALAEAAPTKPQDS